MTQALNSHERTILIASTEVDKPSWKTVHELLQQRGFATLVYKSDDVAQRLISFDMTLGSHGAWQIHYAGQRLDMTSIHAAWYRRTLSFERLESRELQQRDLVSECRALLQGVWNEVPEHAWLNAPNRIRNAETKLTQLAVAAQFGFAVPKTTISNQWQTVHKTLPQNIVLKSFNGILGRGKNLKFIFTKPFANSLESLPINRNPFPGIWQENIIDKKCEWRVTVVGDKVFSARISTAEHAKDDWRRHQDTPAVTFMKGNFPTDLEQKCRAFLRYYGLRFGAFDFIESRDGIITFLECNPNGQFYWLEKELGFPISEAIADELISIANQ